MSEDDDDLSDSDMSDDSDMSSFGLNHDDLALGQLMSALARG